MPVIVEVSVVTKSPRFSVSVKDGIIRIRLTSPPEKGRANAELVEELGKVLGKVDVRIVSGHASHRKRLVVDMGQEEWETALARLLRHV
jgi:uncharacterized protein (TIGR00251 family)